MDGRYGFKLDGHEIICGPTIKNSEVRKFLLKLESFAEVGKFRCSWKVLAEVGKFK